MEIKRVQKEKYELTVITVCYNSEKTIKKTLMSVVPQLSDEVEYLIVDGKSTDNTMNIIRDVQKQYMIRVISEPDKGIYDAMNKAMRLARGRWLLYINSDDRLKDGVLAQILPVLKKDTQSDCICTDVVMCRQVQKAWFYRIWTAEKVDRRVFLNLPACHQGMYIRREKMQEMEGFDCEFPIAADWDFVCRLYRTGGKSRVLSVQTAYFIEGGVSNKWLIWERYKVRKKNHGGIWIFYGLLWDLKNRLRSDVAKLLLGQKKEMMAVRKRYTKCRESEWDETV